MAPLDRQQRRKERERGAGYSAISNLPKPTFNFSIPQKAVKQPSLPPQRSGRRSRTPILNTPRGPHGSAQRARSASAQRSSAHKSKTPGQITPQLGKRKRGNKYAQSADEDDGELDQLSPDNDRDVRSVEKSRKVVGPVSPIREEAEEMGGELDELSIIGDERGSARKVVKGGLKAPQETPAPAVSKPLRSMDAVERTQLSEKNNDLAGISRQEPLRTSRKSKSMEPAPTTPTAHAIVARRKIDHSMSSVRSVRNQATPTVVHNVVMDEAEDELLMPRPNTATPVTVPRTQVSQPSPEEQETEIDELSPPVAPTETLPESVHESTPNQQPVQNRVQSRYQHLLSSPTRVHKRGRSIEEDEDPVQSTPAASQPRQIRNKSMETNEPSGDDGPDEISPESERARQRPVKAAYRSTRSLNFSSGAATSFPRDESEEEEEPPDQNPRPNHTHARSLPTQKPRVNLSSEKPLRKRLKHSGVTQSIQVMRLKDSKVKGYTVADTTRTAMEEYIDSRVSLLSQRFQGTQDLDRRKQIKTRINLQLSFREALSERMLDLQDVNDCLTTRTQKLKAFKKHNAELRKDILTAQESRQELALERDNVLAEFEMEKEAFESKKRLHANMFDIQAAIKRGRERAIELNREDEGPDIPLSMLLDNVGRDVGSIGGGLLHEIRNFNGVLERAASFLEGRA